MYPKLLGFIQSPIYVVKILYKSNSSLSPRIILCVYAAFYLISKNFQILPFLDPKFLIFFVSCKMLFN